MKTIAAKYPGKCSHCGQPVNVGDLIAWRKTFTAHAVCHRDFLRKQAEQKNTFGFDKPATPDNTEALDALKAEVERLKAKEPELTADLDMDLVARLIDEAVAKRVQPTTVTVEVKRNGESKRIDGAHFQFQRLVKLLGAGIPVYLWGPAGSGKTTAAQMAADALGNESELDTLDPSTFRSMVQGYMTPEGKPVHTTFTRCWEEGKVYIADECDNAPGHVQTLFNSALAQGTAPLAWGNQPRDEDFAFVGTGNTPGRPTREFPDRRPMSAAFADRLYFMFWPLDLAIEAKVAGLPAPMPQIDENLTCTPSEWGSFVQRLREWAGQNMPTLMITPRATIQGIKALALGETPAQVADAMIFRGADAEMKRKALAAVNLPGRKRES